MKIDRRSFLAFSVGGAAGTALSPLPWKLTDDSSIWSQMWPWVPVPSDGKIEYAHSTCSLCPGGCGITVRKINGRPVKIEGREGHPVNQGGICIVGAAGLQYLYGPSRVKTPLKRKGKRGEGHWAPISWEIALAEMAEKLGALRADGPERLACISDAEDGTVPALLKRFLTAYGSPNFIGPTSAQSAHQAAMAAMAGGEGTVAFDVDKADFILSFGSAFLDGWGAPARLFRAYGDRQDRQAQIFQIDYRLSNTAAKSDRFIPVNPGTEGALALGLVHKIISTSAYNPAFVNQFASGFESFKKKVMAAFEPSKVAAITGVSVEVISELAGKFTAARRPVAICGRGRGSTPGALTDTMAVMALNALAGNLNADGGVHLVPAQGYLTWPDPEMDDIASQGVANPRADRPGANTSPIARYLPHRMFQAPGSDRNQPLEALLVADANPLYTYRDSQAVRTAFDQIPFIVSFSSFMDETAKQADLILPNHTYLERYQDVPAPPGTTRPYVGLSQPVVAPQYNTRHIGDVIIALSDRLNGAIAGAFEWKDYAACLKETLGWKWEGMHQNGFWEDSNYLPPSWETMFQTASGKFEFHSDKIDVSWKKTVPEGESGAFPLLLLPYDSIRLTSGSLGNAPFVTKTVADTVLKKDDGFVEINPATAKEYGLKEGSLVMLTTPKGEAKVRAHLSPGMMPGIVAMPTGLGHTAFDDFLAGKGVNINELMGPVEEAASGFDAAWGIRVKLAKV